MCITDLHGTAIASWLHHSACRGDCRATGPAKAVVKKSDSTLCKQQHQQQPAVCLLSLVPLFAEQLFLTAALAGPVAGSPKQASTTSCFGLSLPAA